MRQVKRLKVKTPRALKLRLAGLRRQMKLAVLLLRSRFAIDASLSARGAMFASSNRTPTLSGIQDMCGFQHTLAR